MAGDEPTPSPGRKPARKRRDAGVKLEGSSELVVEDLTAARAEQDAKLAAVRHRRRVKLQTLSHQHETEREDSRLRRWKDRLLTVASLMTCGIVSLFFIIIVVMPGTSDGVRDKAVTSLIGMVTAGAGYLAGKNAPRS